MQRWIIISISLILFTGFAAPAEIQKAAPEFTGTTLEGKVIKLSHYKGKVVLLDFWASWCGPCKREFPFLVQLHHALKDQNFTVIGINVDTDRSKAERFLAGQKVKPDFPIVFDGKGKIAERYQLQGMPTTILIDKNGVIRYRHTGFRDKDRAEVIRRVKELL